MMMRMTVLSPDGLSNVVEHKFQAGKYTPLDLAMNPFWFAVAERLPMWLAPNMVTVLGVIPMTFVYIWYWIVSPAFEQAASRPLLVFTAFSAFVYQTMDAVDGKQARRTGSSSPLGQLFDHGFDGIMCIYQHTIAMMVLIPGATIWPIVALAALQTGFFLTQWHEFHARWLPTALGPLGVTELQFTVMAAALAACVVGPEQVTLWARTPFVFPVVNLEVTNGILVVLGWAAIVTFLSVVCFVSTIKSAWKSGGPDRVGEALSNLIPIAALNFIVFFVWKPSVHHTNTRTICFLTSVLFFYYAAQIILFSMAKMPFPVLQVDTLLPYGALAVASWSLGPEELDSFLIFGSVLASVWVIVWMWRVIEELKEKMNIYAFSLEARVPKAKCQ
eukprot:TRINITY_DN29274_c0_g3_i1.p1 TRINITY_DN29274_c0_g3~~TRINITY_DN29274_c0_g3_i1.p1  ORF type:complete len:388 (-),score=31.56 TRINITY_DN29274_c0_g3_i1:212-1375(-)